MAAALKATSQAVKAEELWKGLGTTRAELTLDFTLPTGQSFRWRKSGLEEYIGVISKRLVRLRQSKEDVQYQVLARGPEEAESSDHPVLVDYFNLQTPLQAMSKEWCAKDSRFCLVSPFFPGARILRQDPVECLFQFICSSNNHISRIHGMVERLCMNYGTHLQQPDCVKTETLMNAVPEKDPVAFYSFPSIEQLSAATEDELRADGFGYRAKFIVGTAKALLEKEGGGDQWLLSLRHAPYSEASQALTTLSGVGPKVAACICLFSLDKHEAIPVDTHVWQLATKYYTPNLRGKTLTAKIMTAVESAFIEKFGGYAGWAHNVLFISDLASSRQFLPEHLRPVKSTPGKAKKTQKVPTTDMEKESVARTDEPAVPDSRPQRTGRSSRKRKKEEEL